MVRWPSKVGAAGSALRFLRASGFFHQLTVGNFQICDLRWIGLGELSKIRGSTVSEAKESKKKKKKILKKKKN